MKDGQHLWESREVQAFRFVLQSTLGKHQGELLPPDCRQNRPRSGTCVEGFIRAAKEGIPGAGRQRKGTAFRSGKKTCEETGCPRERSFPVPRAKPRFPGPGRAAPGPPAARGACSHARPPGGAIAPERARERSGAVRCGAAGRRAAPAGAKRGRGWGGYCSLRKPWKSAVSPRERAGVRQPTKHGLEP